MPYTRAHTHLMRVQRDGDTVDFTAVVVQQLSHPVGILCSRTPTA